MAEGESIMTPEETTQNSNLGFIPQGIPSIAGLDIQFAANGFVIRINGYGLPKQPPVIAKDFDELVQELRKIVEVKGM